MISPLVIQKLEFEKVLKHISNFAITENGKAEVLNLIPSDSHEYISLQGNIVEEAKSILINTQFPPIESISNVHEALSRSRIEGSVLSIKKILEVNKLASISRQLKQFINSQKETVPKLFQVSENLFSEKLLEHQIQRIITENGEVKENASKQLATIRKDIRTKRDDLVKSINKIIKGLKEQDYVREDYLTLRDGRMVIPIKVEHKRHLRGFIHSESSTGQTVYIEPEETLELNNDIVSLSFAENREIERLLKELTKHIGEYSFALQESLRIVSYIDSVVARANYSIEIIGSFPTVDKTKPVKIMDARHPLLIKKIGRSNSVPLDLELDDCRIIIITGPNAGGKTVVLKTLGILSLMLQSGIHIPVNPDSNFHIFKKILLDIGDEQSIEDDLSTFSSHLKNLKNIISEADESSLILLDEVGTGTDPTEGAALASSILLDLLRKKSIVFASTHHGSLKLFAYSTDGIENAAMQFDHQNLTPTYKFTLGIPGSSYAFDIARRIGFEQSLITNAKSFIESDKHKLEEFLSEIENKSNQLNKKLNELEVENTRLKGLSDLYKNSYDKLNKEKKEILKKTKVEAENYLSDINKKIEKVIKDIKETQAEKETIKKSKIEISQIKELNKKYIEPEVDSYPEKADFKVGGFAQVKNSHSIGKIIDINSDKNRATLLVGSLKVQVKLSELIPAKQEKESTKRESFDHFIAKDVQYRLDIRGERAEEAEFKVIKYLDEANQMSLNRVEILHGKGTGALKKMVQEILKKHENVKEFNFAPIEQGGDGITIVELK